MRSIFNVLVPNNSQLTIILRYFINILKTTLTISCEKTKSIQIQLNNCEKDIIGLAI